MREPENSQNTTEEGANTPGKGEGAAEYILKGSPLTPTDAARLIMELLEGSPCHTVEELNAAVNHCRRVIQMGLQAYELSSHSVKFRAAVTALQLYKNSVRERTMGEIRQICQRIMTEVPEWADLSMREIDTALCQRTIQMVFPTVPMQRKAKSILHSVFAHARLNGWCSVNPLDLVVLPPYVEKKIQALDIEQVKRLLDTALQMRFRPCAVALGLMLWAGVRPNEVMRLHHRDINFEDRVITVPARHSKTGGSRQVTMYPALFHWLRRVMPIYMAEIPVVPAAWNIRWAELRHAAGFKEWVPDILRHTFASYHLKHFRDLNALQVEMGHASAHQLRTRYLAMENVSRKAAKFFWEYGVPSSSK